MDEEEGVVEVRDMSSVKPERVYGTRVGCWRRCRMVDGPNRQNPTAAALS